VKHAGTGLFNMAVVTTSLPGEEFQAAFGSENTVRGYAEFMLGLMFFRIFEAVGWPDLL
jgi:hypothetical protein